jgi:hypothetical protein
MVEPDGTGLFWVRDPGIPSVMTLFLPSYKVSGSYYKERDDDTNGENGDDGYNGPGVGGG